MRMRAGTCARVCACACVRMGAGADADVRVWVQALFVGGSWEEES